MARVSAAAPLPHAITRHFYKKIQYIPISCPPQGDNNEAAVTKCLLHSPFRQWLAIPLWRGRITSNSTSSCTFSARFSA